MTDGETATTDWKWFDRPFRKDWMWWYSLALMVTGPLGWLLYVGVPLEFRRARRRKRAGLQGFESRGTLWAVGCLTTIAGVVVVLLIAGIATAIINANDTPPATAVIATDDFEDEGRGHARDACHRWDEVRTAQSDIQRERLLRETEETAVLAADADSRWDELLDGVHAYRENYRVNTEDIMFDYMMEEATRGMRAMRRECQKAGVFP